MLLSTKEGYYIIPLQGVTVVCKSGTTLDNPIIMFELLSFSNLQKIDLMITSGIREDDIHEEIVLRNVLGILYKENEEIDYIKTPAGVITHLGEKILHHSRDVVLNVFDYFASFSNQVTLIDQVMAFVSRYTCTPLDQVKKYPVDKLLKDFATVQAAFPHEVQPLIPSEEEQESSVGG